MKRTLFVLLAGLLLILAVIGAYYSYVGLGRPFSADGEDWAQFGGYFGGVAGTLLSFISILLLVYTVHLQSEQLSDAQHETLKRDLLAHVSKADEEIDHCFIESWPTQAQRERQWSLGISYGVLLNRELPMLES